MPDPATLVATLIRAGLLPSLVEDALAAAEAAGQSLPTEQDTARDSVVTDGDVATAQNFWWYSPDVPQAFRRLLTAQPIPPEAADAA